ncbi:hypothetical protein U91I_00336 [alpha proteobacterium U9-1i]|nr:hypothetical protein U91I_00336 [alpha proteobacterium U9-1i]
MKRTTLLIASLAALAACSSAQSLGEGERLNWRCDGDKAFSLRFAAGAVEAYAAGQTHYLQPTGDGIYSNGAVTYTEGDNTSLTGAPGGPYENCRRAGMLRRLL